MGPKLKDTLGIPAFMHFCAQDVCHLEREKKEGGESEFGFRPIEFAETKELFHETEAREKDVEMVGIPG